MESDSNSDSSGEIEICGGAPPLRFGKEAKQQQQELMEDRKPVLGLIVNEVEASTSRPEFPPGMAPKMLKLVKVLNELEAKLEPLISKPHHEVLAKLPPIERAKVGLMEVYTINSLFWALMRTSGENIDSTLRDDYKVEMARLKETQARLSEVEARSQRQRVDTRVASRMVQHGLGIISRRDQDEDEESLQPQSYTKQRHNKGQCWTSQSTNNEYQDEVNNEYQDGDNYEYQDEVNNEYQDDVNNQYHGEVYNQYPGEVNNQYHGEGNNQYPGEVNNQYQDEVNYEYQDEVDDRSGYQDQDESPPQPVSVKNKKKKKKKVDDSMLQENDMDYQEASNNNSEYQGSDEDSFLPTPPNKIRKKDKSVGKLELSDENDIPSASNGMLKKKKGKGSSKIPTICEAAADILADILPDKKFKKKKVQSNDNSFENTVDCTNEVDYINEYQNTGDNYEELVALSQGKKKRKIEEELVYQSNEDSKSDLMEDDQIPMPVSKKKQKKKKKQAITWQSEVSDYADTSGNRIPDEKKKKRQAITWQSEVSDYADTSGNRIPDDQVPMPVSKKKQKKKKKQANTSQSEVSDYLDTSGSRISYQFEDDHDCSNKGRSWYEEGWT